MLDHLTTSALPDTSAERDLGHRDRFAFGWRQTTHAGDRSKGEGTSHVCREPIVVNVHSPGTNECNYVFMLSLHS